MAQPSLESAADQMAKLNNIGFVEFTTNLVRNVYNVIVQSSMDQMRTYADLVKDVSQSVGEYQKSLGLGDSDDPHPTQPSTESKALLKNCEKYAIEVLSLSVEETTSGQTVLQSYKFVGVDTDDAINRQEAIINELKGIDVEDGTGGTIEEILSSVPNSSTITITSTQKPTLDKIIAFKLRKAASENYTLLLTILKMGMQKIVIKNGLIATKLTFHVDASETSTLATSDINMKTKSFNLSGGISAGFKKIGGNGFIGGGYSSTNLSVSVVNERSSAVANISADIVGEVRIEFMTDSFPSIN